MHYIQQAILGKLITNHVARFSELKPNDIGSNLFMYHLKALIRDGYVDKLAAGQYQLTIAGQHFADGLSLETFRPRSQPRIVTLMAVTNSQGEWLWFRRGHQPLLGQIGFPYGEILMGETVLAAAARALQDKTGITANLRHSGDGYVAVWKNNELVSHILFHLFAGISIGGQLKPEVSAGRAFWARPQDVAMSELMPSVPDLLALAADPSRWFAELTYRG